VNALVVIAGAAHWVAALDARAFFARDVVFDGLLHAVGAAPQALQLALDQLGMLVGHAIDFLRHALGGALREPQHLDQVIGRVERAAAGLGIHRASIIGAGEALGIPGVLRLARRQRATTA